jgi:hypothetical protein
VKVTEEITRRTLNVFLRRIANGRLDEVGILADWLEEIGHKRARPVRKVHDEWSRTIASWKAWKPRRGKARYQEIALWHRWCREQLAAFFGREWKCFKLGDLWDLNRELTPLPKIEEEADV